MDSVEKTGYWVLVLKGFHDSKIQEPSNIFLLFSYHFLSTIVCLKIPIDPHCYGHTVGNNMDTALLRHIIDALFVFCVSIMWIISEPLFAL